MTVFITNYQVHGPIVLQSKTAFADFLTPILYCILTLSTVAIDKTDSTNNGIEYMHSRNNANLNGPDSYCEELYVISE